MATGDVSQSPTDQAAWAAEGAKPFDLSAAVAGVLQAVASLRLTVLLFALSIFLVFVGTLAQVDHDIWHVVNNTYFRVWVAQVELRTFGRLIAMFTEFNASEMTAWFPFPGGKTIGFALAANLLAAHAIRFKTAAKGNRLALGLGVIAIGAVATAAVIASGMDNAVESELSPEFCNYLWLSLVALLAASALGAVYLLITTWGRIGLAEWSVAAILTAALVSSATSLLLNPDWQLNPSGLRILWQLAKCTLAAGVLLAGCVMVFKKRAGIVLLHGGVGLLLASELVTDLTANESRLQVREGATSNETYDMRTTELAIINRSSGGEQRVTVVPQSLLASAAGADSPVSHADLPFDIRVADFFYHTELQSLTAETTNPATQGVGATLLAKEAPSMNGLNGAFNEPSAYVELLDKSSGESLGVYLVSAKFDPILDIYLPPRARGQLSRNQQTVSAGGTNYEVALRFKREYKTYSLTLNDFRFDKYVGTTKAKNFSSEVRLVDNDQNVDRDFHISMNNPLRYSGDTLYQSGFDNALENATILQVVTNRGWMLPYVSLMVVGIGMLYQFLVTLWRFINRRVEAEAREAKKLRDAGAIRTTGTWTLASPQVWFPLLMAVLVGGYLMSKARSPKDAPLTMQLQAFGALPLAEGGRIKPYDTLARTKLQFLSGRQEVKLEDGTKLPAIQWMLDVVSGQKIANDYRVFRIENLDLLDTLGLEPRPGSFRYSYSEIFSQKIEGGEGERPTAEFDKQKQLIRGVPNEERTVFQKKVGELASRVSNYELLIGAFGSPRFTGDMATIRQEMAANQRAASELRTFEAARPVAPAEVGGEWLTLFEAKLLDLFSQAASGQRNMTTVALSRALDAYADDDRRAFNEQVRRLENLMEEQHAELQKPENAEKLAGLALSERLDPQKVAFETTFNAFSPFYYCAVCYLIAFVLAVASWLGWRLPLSRAATAVIVVTFLVHTYALLSRMYISGRPPVTNLYSTAIFIGWGAVLLGLLIEAIFRIGIGNVVASVIGFMTLVVAYQLSLDGDTFTVMQAVLDTQFWLATHVVTVTFGYSTTFFAGLLGILYLLCSRLGRLPKEHEQLITRMTYGILCFAMLFSFVGTVLGGLWGDDSWGRFWGWDPKENGALIIVLWNALILHARWGKLVGPTGLATLAVLGNIVTTWSWFGVNELGVGLHAYGASEKSTAQWLLVFAVSQLVIASIAFIPARDNLSRSEPAT